MAEVDQELRRVLAENVRHFRDNLDLTQDGLAALMEAERAFISLVERRRVNITLDNLGRIAKSLGVEAYELLRPRPGLRG